MRSFIWSCVAVCCLASAVGAAEPGKAPSPAAILQAMAEAGKPGAEHQKLQPLIGDWNMTMTMWTDPSQPPATLNATVERKWVLGNRFVQESLKGEFAGKTFEGMGLWGYDSHQKKFTIARACGLCGISQQNTATVDATGKKFECSTEERCPLTGEMVKGRDEVVIESPDRIVVNVYKTIEGKDLKVMEIVTTRKK